MVASKMLVAGAFVASASAVLLPRLADGLEARADLSEGSPAYNCHDNCGNAILIVKAGGDVCTDEAFLYDYANCVQCAGPDNYDIWKYYGNSISAAAGECGLATEPLEGEQEDVGPAYVSGDDDEEEEATSSAAPEPETTAAETTAETTVAETTTEPEPATSTAVPASTEAVASTEAPATSAEPTTMTTSVASGVAAPTGANSTYTSTGPASTASVVVTAAANGRSVAVGVVGAAAIGAAVAIAL